MEKVQVYLYMNIPVVFASSLQRNGVPVFFKGVKIQILQQYSTL